MKKFMQFTATAIVTGATAVALASGAGAATGDKVAYDKAGTYSATQNIARPQAVDGTVRDSFKAVPGEFADQAVQGTARDSFKAAPVDHPLQCGKYELAAGSVMTCA